MLLYDQRKENEWHKWADHLFSRWFGGVVGVCWKTSLNARASNDLRVHCYVSNVEIRPQSQVVGGIKHYNAFFLDSACEAKMVAKLPYMALPSAIPKILSKISEEKRPKRFTQDYLETMLGFSGGNHRAFLPMLKRMGFLEQDGTPAKLYDQYRNDDARAMALAAGVRNAYPEIFDRNQFAHRLPKEKLASLVTEMTGQAKDSPVGKLIATTFWTLKEGADFDNKLDENASRQAPVVINQEPRVSPQEEPRAFARVDCGEQYIRRNGARYGH